MSKAKSTLSVITSFLWDYSEQAAKAVSPAFYSCWLYCREHQPEKFATATVLYN